jgi:ABC-type uncharacterized transport system permease subunit
MPMNNYPVWMQRVGLFILPIFAIANPASFTFLNKTNKDKEYAMDRNYQALVEFAYAIIVWRNLIPTRPGLIPG